MTEDARPTSAVRIEILDAVALLELRRPPANFFDLDLIVDLEKRIRELDESRECRAVVLCSEGRHFCAGADYSHGGVGASRVEATRRIYRAAAALFRSPLPIVAAVQGAAVGGGLGLACVADLRVAGPGSRFHANFVRLGFHQGFGLSESLPHIIGSQQALRLLTTAERIGGADAHRIGLVDRLVDDDAIRDAAINLATGLAGNAPLAVRAVRATLRAALADRVESVLERELAEQERLWATEDCAIGLAAGAARETPHFVGR